MFVSEATQSCTLWIKRIQFWSGNTAAAVASAVEGPGFHFGSSLCVLPVLAWGFASFLPHLSCLVCMCEWVGFVLCSTDDLFGVSCLLPGYRWDLIHWCLWACLDLIRFLKTFCISRRNKQFIGDVCRYGWILMSSPCDLQMTSSNLHLPVERSEVQTVWIRLTFLSRTAELCSVNLKMRALFTGTEWKCIYSWAKCFTSALTHAAYSPHTICLSHMPPCTWIVNTVYEASSCFSLPRARLSDVRAVDCFSCVHI